MKIKIINKSNYELPTYATTGSAGVDLKANIDEPIILHPTERVLVPTGLFIELPQGYEAQIRPRSGLAILHGLTVLNSPGTIDSDFRGEIKIILINLGQAQYVINPGERIAQMVFAKYEQAKFELVEELSNTERGAGGFGHTGK